MKTFRHTEGQSCSTHHAFKEAHQVVMAQETAVAVLAESDGGTKTGHALRVLPGASASDDAEKKQRSKNQANPRSATLKSDRPGRASGTDPGRRVDRCPGLLQMPSHLSPSGSTSVVVGEYAAGAGLG